MTLAERILMLAATQVAAATKELGRRKHSQLLVDYYQTIKQTNTLQLQIFLPQVPKPMRRRIGQQIRHTLAIQTKQPISA